MKKRPICSVEGCNSLVAPTGKRKDGSTIYKKVCSEHHKQIHGIGDWKYKKYRKDYCENRDGRLGFKCRYKIRYVGQLQVDHINGRHSDNRVENLRVMHYAEHGRIHPRIVDGSLQELGTSANVEAAKYRGKP